jgi:hypothetical protein
MIKSIIVFIILLPISFFAQKTITIKGFVLDASSNVGLPYANVVIKTSYNDSILYGTITDSIGIFRFDKIKIDRSFYLKAFYIGYNSDTIGFVIENIKQKIECKISMKYNYEQLSTVEIIAKNKKIEIDKTTIPIDSNLLANTTNTFELLQKIPEFKTNPINNSVSLKGKENTYIMLNGVKTEKSIDIRTIDPNDIEKIEVVEIPSGEFENSVDGVINIIIKKDAHKGVSIYSENEYARNKNFSSYNTLKYKLKKSSFGIDYNYGNKHNIFSEDIRIFNNNLNSEYNKTSVPLLNKDISNEINMSYDYNLSDFSYLSFYSSNLYYLADKSIYGIVNNYIDQNINYDLTTTNRNKANLLSSNNTLFYETQISTKGVKFSINNNLSINNGSYFTLFIDSNKMPIDSNVNRTYIDNSIKYANNLIAKIHIPVNDKNKINVGVLGYYQTFNNNYEDNNIIKEISYNMYKSNVFADYTVDFKNISFRFGLKYENYNYNLSNNRNSDYSFQPSIYLAKKITNFEILALSYKKESFFPSIWQISSPTIIIDSLNMNQSNEKLKPQQDNHFRIAYKYTKDDNLLSVSFNLKYYQNMIQNYYFLTSNNVLSTSPKNVDGKIKNYINFNGSNIIFQLFMLDYDIDVYRESFLSNIDDRINYSWKGEFTLMMAMPFRFRIGAVYNYYGKILHSQGYYNLSPEIGLFIGKSFFDDRVAFSMSYIFCDKKEDYTIEDIGFKKYSHNISYEQIFLFRVSIDLYKWKEVQLRNYSKFTEIDKK